MNILLADRNGTRAAALAAQLQAQDDAFTITLVIEQEPLLDAVRRVGPDIVIVDMSRPDRDSLDSVRALNAKPSLPVIMFVDDDDAGFMEEAIAAGVTSYYVHGVALPAIKPILRTAIAFFRRAQQLSNRLAEAEEQLAVRQTIDAAKRLLMTRDGLNEPAAHRFLQRRAMDGQKKIADIAAQLLRESLPPGRGNDKGTGKKA